MSKISQYLNEHLLGEVTTSTAVRKCLSTDGSMLMMTPEIVAYPRVTNDIRKILRFTYQLAQKGHAISVTTRGAGTDQTGAAIGTGIIVNTTAHMHNIYEFDAKQRLVRVQPGTRFGSLENALHLQGFHIPAFPDSIDYSTVGGAVANNASGRMSGQKGAMDESVAELEVVLVNGDAIQTSRLSKKELSKKKGLQTFEGEIYRAVDNLIEDNSDLLDEQLTTDVIDNAGYVNLRKVKQKNGSFDLTPLFVGSQGTLGVISEMILKADFYNTNEVLLAVAVPDANNFYDLIDELRALSPDTLEVFDGRLVTLARKHSKQYTILKLADTEDGSEGMVAGLLLCSFQDFSERVRKKKLKKAQKLVGKYGGIFESASTPETVRELAAVRGIAYSAVYSDEKSGVVPSVFRGVYVPPARFDEFREAVALLEKTTGIALPYSGFATDGVYSFWPQFVLRAATDKQKLLKLYDAFTKVVYDHGGSAVAESGEGRLKAPFVAKQLSPELAKVYTDLRAIFDPHGTLNAGVKQPVELRSVVSHLRPGYDGIDFADYSSPS